MDRKAFFVLLLFFSFSAAAAGKVLYLKGSVPESFALGTQVRPDGYIQPVIRSNVTKNSNQFKIRAHRSPASINGVHRIVIEAN